MLAALCATLTITLVVTSASPERPARRPVEIPKTTRDRRARAPAAPRAKAKPSLTPSSQAGGELARARALLAEVKRDPAKRRYRDRWEKAIAALEKAARGRDTAPALLDAARARYALYRYSQVEADRSAAIRLASRAEKAGAREAKALRLAIRQEMGDPPEREPARSRPRIAATTKAAPPVRAPAPAKVERAPPPPRTPALATRDASRVTAPGVSGPKPTVAVVLPPGSSPTRAVATAAAAPPREGDRRSELDEEQSIDAILERALAGEPAPAEEGAATSHAVVSELKSWSNHDYTRVGIYLSRSVPFQRVDLPNAPGRSRQVALDLRPAKIAAARAHPVGDALVQGVRAVQLDPDTVRVTLDLSGREELSVFPLEDPARLIVDVGAAAPAPAPVASDGARDGGPAPPASGAPPAPSPGDELGARGPIRRVIVDAGHGGHDTGAIGPTRVREKDVTLAMAKRLAKRLRARGYEVVLTRDDDRYVPLEERTAIANARHGDLFVSLHANAHPRHDRSGVETYVLNVADDRYAARLAARENGAFGEQAVDVPVLRRILSDLEAKRSVESSRRLATAVQHELCAGIRARFGEVRDLGVKSALFYVLVGARMPAVLVETAFISNRAEERRLASAAFQEEVASAVLRAVERVAAADARFAAAR